MRSIFMAAIVVLAMGACSKSKISNDEVKGGGQVPANDTTYVDSIQAIQQ